MIAIYLDQNKWIEIAKSLKHDGKESPIGRTVQHLSTRVANGHAICYYTSK